MIVSAAMRSPLMSGAEATAALAAAAAKIRRDPRESPTGFGANMPLPSSMDEVLGIGGSSPIMTRRFGSVDNRPETPVDELINSQRGVSAALLTFQWSTTRFRAEAPPDSKLQVSIGCREYGLPEVKGGPLPVGPFLMLSEWSYSARWLDVFEQARLFAEICTAAGIDECTGVRLANGKASFEPPAPAVSWPRAPWPGHIKSPLRFANLGSLDTLRAGVDALCERLGPAEDFDIFIDGRLTGYNLIRPALAATSEWWEVTTIGGLRRSFEEIIADPREGLWAPIASSSRTVGSGRDAIELLSGAALEYAEGVWRIAAYGMGSSVKQVHAAMQKKLGIELEVVAWTGERI